MPRPGSFRPGSRPAPYRCLCDSTWPNCNSRCSDSESSRVRPRREYQSPAKVQFELCVIGCGWNDFTKPSKSWSSPRAFSTGSDGTTRFRIGRQRSARGAVYARDRDQIVPPSQSASFLRSTYCPRSTVRSRGSANLKPSSVYSRSDNTQNRVFSRSERIVTIFAYVCSGRSISPQVERS